MKVRLRRPHDPDIRAAFKKITNAVDTATGTRRRWESLDALKARIRLEEVVAEYLQQDPENPGSNRLKFYCFNHEADGEQGGHTPSLYVNVEQQRWGCEAGCFDGHSGDLFDFVRLTNPGLTHKEAVDIVKVWATSRNQSEGRIRIRVKK
jgi:hypothetical protein